MHRPLMKRLGLFALLAALTPWTALNAKADIRCARVDVDLLLKHYQKTAMQREALLAKQAQYHERLGTLLSRRQKLTRAMDALLDEMERQQEPGQTHETYQSRLRDLQNQHRSLTESINELENLHLKQAKQDLSSLVRSSLDEIHAIIHRYAQEQQYHWVIETSGLSSSQMSPLIYARNAPDITQQLLALINE
ncbi:MAG: OmpH family outer membrane protein [Akkermansiaceae bacterium]